MKNLLRSCFKAAHTDIPELLLRNYHLFNDAGLEFEIAEDLGAVDKFAFPDDAATATINGHVATEALNYSATYYWRVRGVAADDTKGAWAVGFFTTKAEPAEAAPPIVVEEAAPAAAPEITLEIPPAPSPVQAIPDYLLWVIVCVGAVLVIAVIVLIVRTRRVA